VHVKLPKIMHEDCCPRNSLNEFYGYGTNSKNNYKMHKSCFFRATSLNARFSKALQA